MVTIETDNGRFEADTIKEAQRLERKAARENAKREAAKAKLRDVARLHAAAAGFDILSRKADGREFPPAWTFFPAGSPHTTAREKMPREFDRACNVEIETADGRGEFDFYGSRFVGNVENGAGWTIAIALSDDSAGVRLFAAGACETEAAVILIPGMKPEDFRRTGEKADDFRTRIGAAAD